MLIATAESRDGYASVAAQVVQAYAPVGTAEFGDGRGAVMALEAKYRLDGESRMQELHDQLANLQVTAAEKYHPTRVIQELRRICVELGVLGDVVFPARKNHAFFRALPDEKYESLKIVLLCDRQRDGSPSKFEDIAARATSYHAMQIRYCVTAKKESAGRGEDNAGSHERALMTVAYKDLVISVETAVEVKEEDVVKILTPITPREETTTTAVTRRRNRARTFMIIAAQVEQAVDAGEAAATKLEEEEDVVE